MIEHDPKLPSNTRASPSLAMWRLWTLACWASVGARPGATWTGPLINKPPRGLWGTSLTSLTAVYMTSLGNLLNVPF
jgi:hypothetical protein